MRGRRARVTGVTYRDGSGEHTVEADVVVGAADLHHVETRLLPRELQTFPRGAGGTRRSPVPGRCSSTSA